MKPQLVVDNSEQGTYEWLKSKIGITGASDVHKMMAGGQGKTRTNLMHKMLCEILTGEPTIGFKSQYMEDGNANEHISRRVYEEITGNIVDEVGFGYIPEEKLGASLDGRVRGTRGATEFKNLVSTEQVKLIVTEKPSSEYIKQVQTQMYVWDLDWVDFCGQSLGSAEHGSLPDEYKFKIVRVERDEAMIKTIREANDKFHKELNELIEKLRQATKEA